MASAYYEMLGVEIWSEVAYEMNHRQQLPSRDAIVSLRLAKRSVGEPENHLFAVDLLAQHDTDPSVARVSLQHELSRVRREWQHWGGRESHLQFIKRPLLFSSQAHCAPVCVSLCSGEAIIAKFCTNFL
jgi:hypothetical protein